MAKISFADRLAALADEDPTAGALVCGSSTMTRAELDRAANRMAHAYRERGVQHGDLVTLAIPNSVEWFVACLAAWKLGAVPNPVSPLLPMPELTSIVALADPALIVGGIDVPGRQRLDATIDLAAFADDPVRAEASPIERVLTSGGSTGTPKLIRAVTRAELDPDEISPLSAFAAERVALVPGPLYHGIPFASAWRSLFGGAQVVAMERFDAAQFLELVERHRVDHVSLVPTMMLRIARLPESERLGRDVSSLRSVLSGGAPCPDWLMRHWIDWLGPDVINEMFGSTERIGGTFITGREWLAHPGSVGRPAGGSRIRILDPQSGDDVVAGTVGEIYMMPPGGRGSAYSYVGAAARANADGWESVGDMGYFDADGYLYVTDRRDDMVLCGGRNIYPAEIESALDSHPKVRSSAVIGLPDPDLGNALHAIVDAREVTSEELRTHVRERLAPYKVPRTFEFVDGPLRDDSGKVRRSALRAARLGP